MAPVHVIEGRTLRKQLEMYIQEGYARIYADKEFQRIDDYLENIPEDIENQSDDDIYLVIDRTSVSDEKHEISWLIDSTETAFYEGDGACRLIFLPSNITYDFSTRFEADGIKFEEPNDNMFSFNSL